MGLNFLIAILMSVPLTSHAEGLDKASEQALRETQQLLTTPAARNEAVKRDPKAQSADKALDSFGGGNKEDIYKLASDVFAELVKESNGDAKKMQELLQQYSRDPAAFANRWTPEQKARLKEISGRAGPTSSPK